MSDPRESEALERWPGYFEQSWCARFHELDRRYSAMLDKFTGFAMANATRPTSDLEAVREACAKVAYHAIQPVLDGYASGTPKSASADNAIRSSAMLRAADLIATAIRAMPLTKPGETM